jgi:hypothetical protein
MSLVTVTAIKVLENRLKWQKNGILSYIIYIMLNSVGGYFFCPRPLMVLVRK